MNKQPVPLGKATTKTRNLKAQMLPFSVPTLKGFTHENSIIAGIFLTYVFNKTKLQDL